MRQLYIYLLISFIFFNTADGGINFSVTTDKTEAVVGEQATITAKVVSDKDLKKITKPSLSSSEYFDHIRTGSDQHQSTSIQIINGKMSQKKEITYLFYYFISFKKEGSFTFPSLTFKYGGQSYSSKPFQISVGKEQTGKKVSSGISVSVRTNKRCMLVNR